MIEGVIVKQLKVVPDERGYLMEILRSDDRFFKKFGQVYVTSVYHGVVKAWHMHLKQTDHFCCIKGMVKLALYDEREGSPTKGQINEFFIGERNPVIVVIPPQIWHGFKGIYEPESLVINIPDQLYNYENPDEIRRAYNDPSIPYSWETKFY